MSELGGGTSRGSDGIPDPDPTAATDARIDRAVKGLRDWIDGQLAIRDERLDGVDKATDLREENFKNFRSRVDEKVSHLAEVRTEQFKTVAAQLREREMSAGREAAIRKDAAAQRDAATKEAIDKSERATAETIKTNQELNKATTDALTKGLDELKLKVSAIESVKIGATEQKTETQASVGTIAAIIGSALALIAAASLYLSRPDPVPPTIVEVPTQTTP